jgi:hypothetical protein
VHLPSLQMAKPSRWEGTYGRDARKLSPLERKFRFLESRYEAESLKAGNAG